MQKIDNMYSVVVPCYMSNQFIKQILHDIFSDLDSLNINFEVICVDDGSPDNVFSSLLEFQVSEPRLRLLRHSFNMGQQVALITGMKYARGSYIITMDDDGQYPSSELANLISLSNDYDVIIGAPKFKKHSWSSNVGSFLVRKVIQKSFGMDEQFRSSSFRLMKRRVVEYIINNRTAFPFITGSILTFTRNIKVIEVNHRERISGVSNYTFTKQVSLAMNLIVNYTRLPLTVFAQLGIVISALSFLFLGYVVLSKIFISDFVDGYASIVAILSFFGGINLIGLSLLSEYLIRIIRELHSVDAIPLDDSHS
ncbi:glycosyltransferase family 2 protein [Vibrio cholerae]|uniref:glycosyltransferase family 2 protein n=1 Tax=Vibrio cholerae TaxID=666 RepID=UPI000E0A03DE|nr:glycosyltransferase family 2 protein [Vibrio cholerae]EGQ9836761.1 glycosyltransferase family 2 protein [Vibrio cholerae]EGR1835824.1 glycosyltransferase family 2 protein [Vibrio cholerae]EGR4363009.1 glycosyltransferase family 2 protein [Vibrio cholerae]EJL6470928.1 glycosyltransferase family 2 protein [Vibrio cholerae]EJL6553662.1 glycosyltransferase family 2 protein [Vibrio cholerae]